MNLFSYIDRNNYNDKVKFILGLLDSPSNELLIKALKSNNIDNADILIDKGIAFLKSIIKDLYDSNTLNFYNLKYILSKGYYELENNDMKKLSVMIVNMIIIIIVIIIITIIMNHIIHMMNMMDHMDLTQWNGSL